MLGSMRRFYSVQTLVWTITIVLITCISISALVNGVAWVVLGAILIPLAALLLVANSIFGTKPISDCKWEHFACFVVLTLMVSCLLLAASGTMETIDIGGNKVAFVRQQVKEVKLLAENVADLALLATKNGLRSASVDWMGPDIRIIEQTRNRTVDLLNKSGTDPSRIDEVKREFDREIETSLKREIFYQSEDSPLLRANLFPIYKRESLIEGLQKAGQLNDLSKKLVERLDYFLKNGRLPPDYTPP